MEFSGRKGIYSILPLDGASTKVRRGVEVCRITENSIVRWDFRPEMKLKTPQKDLKMTRPAEGVTFNEVKYGVLPSKNSKIRLLQQGIRVNKAAEMKTSPINKMRTSGKMNFSFQKQKVFNNPRSSRQIWSFQDLPTFFVVVSLTCFFLVFSCFKTL